MEQLGQATDVVCEAALAAEGATDRATRQAAFAGADVSAVWARYVEKVRHASHAITDADISALLQAGVSEEAIFEMTVVAALGAADQRLKVGLQAMEGPDSQ